jgi:hypothetical protein
MIGSRKQGFLLIALGIGIVFLLFLIGFPGTRASQPSYRDSTSTFFADRSGTKAIYLVLERLLPGVERWLKPLHQLPDPGADNAATLLIMGPDRPLVLAEADRLDRWVRSGGQLIINAEGPWSLEPPKADRTAEGSYLARHGFRFAPEAVAAAAERAPVEYTGPGGTLFLGGGALESGDYTVLFGGPAVKAGQRSLGAGRIIVVADRMAWSNRRLSESPNALWLVSTALAWGNGRVLVDEFHHGFEKTRGTIPLLLSFLASFRGLLFVQVALAGLLFLLAEGRRFGPIVELPDVRKRSPLERVEALGALLGVAQARGFAVRAIHQLLARRLWQARYGSIQATRRASAQKLLQSLPTNYLSLIERLGSGASCSEEDLVEAARQAGRIMKEHQYGRKYST